MSDQEMIDRLAGYSRSLGVAVEFGAVPEGASSLAGIMVRDGTLVIDREGLPWPGDILHEAAHIATAPPSRRGALNGTLSVTPAEEMAALAWSYAAAVAAEIDPHVVFHEGGYRNGGAYLVAQYASGLPPGGPGVPMLQWWGMTSAFPHMTHWIRQTEDPP
jgi:hypothetical protein